VIDNMKDVTPNESRTRGEPSLRQNLPTTAFPTRIENTHGGGVPDVYIVWDGMPFWLELKVCNVNALNIRVAWNMAHFARGGLSFFLVKTLSSGVLYLFPADQGPELAKGGCSAAQGARFESMGALVEGLRASVLGHYDALRPAPRD
jgi:hypothetical protein